MPFQEYPSRGTNIEHYNSERTCESGSGTMPPEPQNQRTETIGTCSNRHWRRSFDISVPQSMPVMDNFNQLNEPGTEDPNHEKAEPTRSCSQPPLVRNHGLSPSALKGLDMTNVQQQLPCTPTITGVHEVNYSGAIAAERQHPDTQGSPNPPNEANPAVNAGISVKLEDTSPSPYSPPRVVDSPRHSSLLVTAAKGPTLRGASSRRESGTLPSNSHSNLKPESQSNSRFDRNEAWDMPEDTKIGMHHSLFSPHVLSPIKRQRGRPSKTRVEKMKLENYKALVVPTTRNGSLGKNIRDGFAKEETFLSGNQHSVKRRRRSPPPPGIGSLSVSFGPKPTITSKTTKRTGVRKNFIIDPDLDPDSKNQEQTEGFNLPHNPPMTSDRVGQSYQHVLPSIEKITTDHNIREPLVLPSLRTYDSVRRFGSPRYSLGGSYANSLILAEDTDYGNGLLWRSSSRQETTDSEAFQTYPHSKFRLWASSMSPDYSDTGRLNDSRGSVSNDAPAWPGNSTEFTDFGSTVAQRSTASSQTTLERNNSRGRESPSSSTSFVEMYTYGESQMASGSLTTSLQRLQEQNGGSISGVGALEELKPRPAGALPMSWR